MTSAFDFGSYRLRSLSQRGSQLVAHQARTGYQVIAKTDAWVRLLSDLAIPYADGPNTMTVIGGEVDRIEGLCPIPLASILPDGQLSQDDPAARQILAQLVQATLPVADSEGEICCITLPGAAYENHGRDNSELDLCTRLIELQGYDIRILSSSMAVVLAAGEATSFSGIGINLGANSCTVGLSRKGVELACWNIPTGGDWIDESIAKIEERYAYDTNGNCYLDSESVRNWREDLTSSIAEPMTERQRLLREHYDQIISQIISKTAEPLRAVYERNGLNESVNIYVAGGLSQMTGFNRVIARYVQTDHNFSLPVASVRVVQDDGFLTSRGCLINAEIETGMLKQKAAA